MSKRIIIAGSRNFNDYKFLKDKCDSIINQLQDNDITIISGGAKGADKLAEKYAIEKGYTLKVFKAPWKEIDNKPISEIGSNYYGLYWKLAGPYRNELMADNADILIAFDMGTNGTKDMINKAKRKNLETFIYKIK